MDNTVSDKAIITYIEQVRVSGVMGKSARRLRLLEYLITTEARGEGDTLKAYTIGLDVFEKPDDFDPAEDSSVRVEMGRLRSALALFEGSTFNDVALEVEVPVGTYRPNITLRATVAESDENSETPTAPATELQAPKTRRRRAGFAAIATVIFVALVGAWYYVVAQRAADDGRVQVALMPFEGNPELATAVESALRRSLARNQRVSVLSTPVESVRRVDAHFVLHGLITDEWNGKDRVSIELVNVATDRVVWAHSAVLDETLDIDSSVGQAHGNELRVRLVGASKEMLEGRDPETLAPEQLFVMATWLPGVTTNTVEWEMERIALMELALEKNPDYGAAHAVMADKLALLANVYEPFDTDEKHERLNFHARRAIELSAFDPDVIFNVAQARWHSGKIEEATALMNRVLELDPSHDVARFLSLVIPYTCAVPPGHVLQAAISFDNQLSADNPIRWLTLSGIAALHSQRGDTLLALNAERRAAVLLEVPYSFMRHAMLWAKVGGADVAETIIRQQRINWPKISPTHFAEVTVPRLCHESPESSRFIQDYESLAAILVNRL